MPSKVTSGGVSRWDTETDGDATESLADGAMTSTQTHHDPIKSDETKDQFWSAWNDNYRDAWLVTDEKLERIEDAAAKLTSKDFGTVMKAMDGKDDLQGFMSKLNSDDRKAFAQIAASHGWSLDSGKIDGTVDRLRKSIGLEHDVGQLQKGDWATMKMSGNVALEARGQLEEEVQVKRSAAGDYQFTMNLKAGFGGDVGGDVGGKGSEATASGNAVSRLEAKCATPEEAKRLATIIDKLNLAAGAGGVAGVMVPGMGAGAAAVAANAQLDSADLTFARQHISALEVGVGGDAQAKSGFGVTGKVGSESSFGPKLSAKAKAEASQSVRYDFENHTISLMTRLKSGLEGTAEITSKTGSDSLGLGFNGTGIKSTVTFEQRYPLSKNVDLEAAMKNPKQVLGQLQAARGSEEHHFKLEAETKNHRLDVTATATPDDENALATAMVSTQPGAASQALQKLYEKADVKAKLTEFEESGPKLSGSLKVDGIGVGASYEARKRHNKEQVLTKKDLDSAFSMLRGF